MVYPYQADVTHILPDKPHPIPTETDIMSASSSLPLKDMANAIRALSMDGVEKAASGHPGMPMGMADVATVLFSKFMTFDPSAPEWSDRDRFILSGGHGSMLLYSLLYLTGYEKMTVDELKNFRQLGSLTPGHPEVMPSCGIEMTTGPLGQGIATAVGFALAERMLAARFGEELQDHYTYVTLGDGDLMEGISHEACSLAANLKLSRLIVLYDDNGITIDGKTDISFPDDTPKRFEAYGWDVQSIDGHNMAEIEAAIAAARKTQTPSLICCKTTIGFGAPNKQGTSGVHGSPLGAEEIQAARKALNWPHAPFDIPEEILSAWRAVGARSKDARAAWETRLENAACKAAFEAAFTPGIAQDVLRPLIDEIKAAAAKDKPKLATRKASGNVLDKLVPALPKLVGGSADLGGSVNTRAKGSEVVAPPEYKGQYVHYGVREHGMAAAMNGMALHGGIIPYAGTFLSFSDYCRPSIRLAALMKTPSIFVMTHDSIGLGEDGPTHQPVEHLAALRAIPNLQVMRPCDQTETAECWELAIRNTSGPSVLSLTRQGLPAVRGDLPQDQETEKENLCARGAYILREADGDLQAVLMASGSEVEIALDAKTLLERQGIGTRVVSVPCLERFLRQSERTRAEVLGPSSCIRCAVEAGVRMGWDALLGESGLFVGMRGFGESGPYKELYAHFGITAEDICEKVLANLS